MSNPALWPRVQPRPLAPRAVDAYQAIAFERVAQLTNQNDEDETVMATAAEAVQKAFDIRPDMHFLVVRWFREYYSQFACHFC